MKKQPPWKAENARIRAEITARKKKVIRIDAQEIMISTASPITLEASAFENPIDGLLRESVEEIYRRKLTDMILAKIRKEELISVKQVERLDGIKQFADLLITSIEKRRRK